MRESTQVHSDKLTNRRIAFIQINQSTPHLESQLPLSVLHKVVLANQQGVLTTARFDWSIRHNM